MLTLRSEDDAVLQHAARVGIDQAALQAARHVLRRRHLVEAGVVEQLGPFLELLVVDDARVGGVQLDEARRRPCAQ